MPACKMLLMVCRRWRWSVRRAVQYTGSSVSNQMQRPRGAGCAAAACVWNGLHAPSVPQEVSKGQERRAAAADPGFGGPGGRRRRLRWRVVWGLWPLGRRTAVGYWFKSCTYTSRCASTLPPAAVTLARASQASASHGSAVTRARSWPGSPIRSPQSAPTPALCELWGGSQQPRVHPVEPLF